MTVRRINNSWWIDIRHAHVRYRKKSPDDSKSGAQAYDALLRRRLVKGEPLDLMQPDKKQKEREQKFEEFAWQWFEIYVQNNNKHSEISHKKYALRSNLVPFFGKTQIDKISTLQVEQYKSKKLGDGVGKKTINNHLTVLSTCLHTAQDWFDLPKIPKIKKLKIPPLQFKFLSFEECDLLLLHLEGVWREIVFTALKTGLRIGELKGLRWPDINWNNRTLTVKHSWCDYKKGLVSPKSNKDRQIPLTDELYETLLQRRQAKGFIFLDEQKQSFNTKTLNQKIIRACKTADIQEITCHALRHTYASHLVMRGAPLKAIQELMGHAHIQTTMRYAHLSPSSLREAVALLETKKAPLSNFGHYMGNDVPQSSNLLPSIKPLIPENPLFKATN